MVQDYSWKGSLRVIQYVAENGKELVAECMGWAESRRKIIQFLVLEGYLLRGSDGNDLPLPYFSKPLSDHSTLSLENTGDILGCISFLQSLLYN